MRFYSLAMLICFAVFFVVSGLHAAAQQTPLEQTPLNKFFVRQVAEISEKTKAQLSSVTKENWSEKQSEWRTELRTMLGLEPQPERIDLKVTVTGTIHHSGVTIQRLHYQSRPGLYVPANLYLPEGDSPEKGWPAVLYVCGHARVESNGRLLGNKTGYHHHGLWFARHGVACMIIDTVQLGELHGEHHGTYKLGRWDWISRGYTPAGVEAWNAIRGLDVLESWPGVDGKRMGITGRSGGGAYSWYAAALDDRIRAAVPVAGITDLQNHAIDGCVEGHCDCMFMINYFGWDYSKVAALIAPRPLLLANSDNDTIFPLDGVMRTYDQIAKVYGNLGASNNLGLLIAPGPHEDTQELQVGAFKWLLKHLTGTAQVIDMPALKELDANQLAVFERETPADERVTSAGEWFAASNPTTGESEKAHDDWIKNTLPLLLKTALARTANDLIVNREFAPVVSGEMQIDGVHRKWELHQATTEDGACTSVLTVLGDKATHVHLGEMQTLELKSPGIPTDKLPVIEAFIREASAKSLAAAPNATHYFIQSRVANWAASIPGLRGQTQAVRRFYLLGTMPEQIELNDAMQSLKWIAGRKPNDGSKLTLNAGGRMAPIAALAALVCNGKSYAGLPAVAELQLSDYPLDAETGPCLPGLLQATSFEQLLAAAEHSMKVTLSKSDLLPQRLIDSSIEPQQATGMRIVEVDRDRATIWVRATRWSLPNLGDMAELKFEKPAEKGTHNMGPILPETGVEGLRFAVPGVPAEVRVSFRARGKGDWVNTDWKTVAADTDFSALIPLINLQPGADYEVRTSVRGVGREVVSTANGSFRTLPDDQSDVGFRLAVGTCQDFPDRDGPWGFDMYRAMLERKTQAFVMAGDVVYYDQLARSVPLANYHWQRTYGLPTLVNFHRQVPTYFLKDDHDTYVNDSWPGSKFKWTEDFTFEDGQRIFAQQTGLPTPGNRTFRIGKDLQIWLMEGRDYRSPNDSADGPEKSIWGTEQKAWLAQTLKESTAKFKVLISPTPIVGPDRDNKKDNHSNRVFATEGKEIRNMLAAQPNLVTVCGDRHWQYHSVDPETGLNEFSVGPASDRHAGGWDPKDYREGTHRFLRVAGGYLEIELGGAADSRSLTLRHLDTRGNEHHRHVLK